LKKSIIICIFLLLIFSFLFGDFERTTGLIDIPSARVIKGGVWKAYLSGNFVIGKDRDSPADANVGFAYGIRDWGEVTISMLTTVDYTINFNSVLLKESGGVPAIGFGIHNITYRKYVSELGNSEDFGYSDDVDYIKVCRRPHEQFSIFFVATKDMGGFGEHTIGFGRGKYVGYGPNSHLFNSDMLFASTDQKELMGQAHEDAVGLFFGSEWKIIEPFFFILEFDGRDVNTGLCYKQSMFEINLAWTHFEQIGKSHRPRISFGASVTSMALPKGPEYGRVVLSVYDEQTKKPLDFNVNVERGKKGKTFSGREGKFTMKLKPGVYTMKVIIPGYKWKKVKMLIKTGETRSYKLGLEKKMTEEEKQKEREFDNNFVTGVTLYNKGNNKGAMDAFERCLELKPDHEETKEYYEKAKMAFNVQFNVIKNKAEALENQGKLKDALEKYKELLDIDPMNKEIQDKVNALTKRLKRPKPKKPTTPTVTDTDINNWYKSGLSHFSNGNYRKAINMFNKVLRYRPGHSGAKKYLQRARTRLKALGG
jgi:hypothetical protein